MPFQKYSAVIMFLISIMLKYFRILGADHLFHNLVYVFILIQITIKIDPKMFLDFERFKSSIN